MTKLLTPIAFFLIAIFIAGMTVHVHKINNHEHETEVDYKHLLERQRDEIDKLYMIVERLHRPRTELMHAKIQHGTKEFQ
jgi:hypothetical protein